MDLKPVERQIPTDTTMQVVAMYKNTSNKTYCDAVCPNCNMIITVRLDAIKVGGYKKQQCCKKCSYTRRDGKDLQGYTIKYNYLYRVFKDMHTRCYNKTANTYVKYGAKGITVHEDWKDNFIAFVDWALVQGFTYQELQNLQLDKDFLSEKLGVFPAQYGPNTCRFVSKHFNNIIQPKQSNTSSVYIGVNWSKAVSRWEWGIRLPDGKRKRGYGISELDAAQKREEYIIENNLSHRRNNV